MFDTELDFAKHVPPPINNNVILDRKTKLKQDLKAMISDLYNKLVEKTYRRQDPNALFHPSVHQIATRNINFLQSKTIL